MNISKLICAIDEAKRFIIKAELAYNKIQENSLTTITGSKETGAAKRASMDLTRVLADLRKPN